MFGLNDLYKYMIAFILKESLIDDNREYDIKKRIRW